jgi:hypothetical protein
MAPAAVALSKKGWNAVLRHLQSQGCDTGYGRRLYHDVAMNGLGDLQVEGFVPMQIGGTPFARFWQITLEQVQDHVLRAGFLTVPMDGTYNDVGVGKTYYGIATSHGAPRARRLNGAELPLCFLRVIRYRSSGAENSFMSATPRKLTLTQSLGSLSRRGMANRRERPGPHNMVFAGSRIGGTIPKKALCFYAN